MDDASEREGLIVGGVVLRNVHVSNDVELSTVEVHQGMSYAGSKSALNAKGGRASCQAVHPLAAAFCEQSQPGLRELLCPLLTQRVQTSALQRLLRIANGPRNMLRRQYANRIFDIHRTSMKAWQRPAGDHLDDRKSRPGYTPITTRTMAQRTTKQSYAGTAVMQYAAEACPFA